MAGPTPTTPRYNPQTAESTPGGFEWPDTIEEMRTFLQGDQGGVSTYTDAELQRFIDEGPQAIGAPGEGTISGIPKGAARRRRVGIYEDADLGDVIRILINNGVSFSNIQKIVDQWKKDELNKTARKQVGEGDEPVTFTQEDIDAHEDPNGSELLVAVANGLAGADPTNPDRKVVPVITSDRFDKVLREVNKLKPLDEGKDKLRAREDQEEVRDRSALGRLEESYGTAVFGLTGIRVSGLEGTKKGEDRTLANTQEYLKSFFLDVFREDDQVRDALAETLLENGNEVLLWELGLEEFIPDDRLRSRQTGRPIKEGNLTTVEGITNALIRKGVLPKNVGRELIDMYRTGRFELAFNDPRRDPSSAISNLETENHSESLDRKVETKPFPQVGIAEPWTLYLADDLSQSLKDDPTIFLRDFNPNNPLLNRAGQDIQNAIAARYAEFLGGGGETPAGEFLPTDVVGMDTRYGTPPEPEPREFLAQMPERAPSDITSLHPSEYQLKEEAGLDAYYAKAQELLKKQDPTYTQTIQDALMGWRELSDSDRKQVQFAAYLRGEYGDTDEINPSMSEGIAVDPFNVINGDVNDMTAYNVWADAVRSSAFSVMQGAKPLTPMAVIRRIVDTQKSTYRNVLKKDRDSRKSGINQAPVNVELTDPTAIAETARDVGQALMGHLPSDQDYKNIIAMVHAREREDQLAKAKATSEAELEKLNQDALYSFNTLDTLEQDIMGSNVFEDPSGGLNFTDPLALADYGSMLATTDDRVARMKQREIQAPVEPEMEYNPEVNETVGFNLFSSLQNYYREHYQSDIDKSQIEELLGQLNVLLASPVSA